MHFVMQMATLLPIQQMVINQDDRLPTDYYFVITHDSNFVVTNTGSNVVAHTPP
jgi:hypothetical protein